MFVLILKQCISTMQHFCLSLYEKLYWYLVRSSHNVKSGKLSKTSWKALQYLFSINKYVSIVQYICCVSTVRPTVCSLGVSCQIWDYTVIQCCHLAATHTPSGFTLISLTIYPLINDQLTWSVDKVNIHFYIFSLFFVKKLFLLSPQTFANTRAHTKWFWPVNIFI